MKKKNLILLLLLILGKTGFSQTIINAEQLINGVDSTIYSVAFSYSGNRGNLVTDQLGISPSLLILKPKNEFKILGSYAYLSQFNNVLMHSGYVHLRHNYKISERLKTFEFFQIQFNEILLLNRREVYGAGLRYKMIDQDSLDLDIALGPMRELEFLNQADLLPGEVAETKYFRANLVNSFRWKPSKVLTLNNVVYYQPYLGDFADFRLLNDFNLAFNVTKHLNLIVALTTRFDSEPPGTLKKWDNSLNFGFNIKF